MGERTHASAVLTAARARAAFRFDRFGSCLFARERQQKREEEGGSGTGQTGKAPDRTAPHPIAGRRRRLTRQSLFGMPDRMAENRRSDIRCWQSLTSCCSSESRPRTRLSRRGHPVLPSGGAFPVEKLRDAQRRLDPHVHIDAQMHHPGITGGGRGQGVGRRGGDRLLPEGLQGPLGLPVGAPRSPPPAGLSPMSQRRTVRPEPALFLRGGRVRPRQYRL